jgi:hypothetical protein
VIVLYLQILFYSSNLKSFYLQILADEKAALEACHKAEVEQLKSQIAELLDEKEERDGQIKRV